MNANGYKQLGLIELKMLLETETRPDERKAIESEMNRRLGIANKNGRNYDNRRDYISHKKGGYYGKRKKS